LLGVIGFAWLTNQNTTLATEVVEESLAASAEDPKPRFDFYTVLPSQTLDLTSDVEPPDLNGNAQSDLYVLQAGSFRAQKDADRRRGELVLLGLNPTIDQTEGDNGAWYRVYLGPFESRSKMAQARSVTAQQSIDTLLLRRPRSP
jgi:cell division protein FtsN